MKRHFYIAACCVLLVAASSCRTRKKCNDCPNFHVGKSGAETAAQSLI